MDYNKLKWLHVVTLFLVTIDIICAQDKNTLTRKAKTKDTKVDIHTNKSYIRSTLTRELQLPSSNNITFDKSKCAVFLGNDKGAINLKPLSKINGIPRYCDLILHPYNCL